MQVTCSHCHNVFPIPPAARQGTSVICPRCYNPTPTTSSSPPSHPPTAPIQSLSQTIANPPSAFLVLKMEDGSTKHFSVGATNLIGRHPGNSIQILDRMISKEHARIFWQDNSFWIEDLQSRNGTFVNELRVENQLFPLPHGTAIRLGTLQMTFYLEDLPLTTPSTTVDESSRHQVTIISDPGRDNPSIAKIRPESEERDFLPEKEIRDPDTLRKDYEKLRIAHLLNRKIGLELDLERLLNQILEETFHLSTADRGVIFLMNQNGQLLPQVVKQRYPERSKKDDLSVSRTILNRVVSERAAIVCSDAKIDERFSRSESIIMQGIRSTLSVPLIARSGGDVLGVMHLDTQSAIGVFTEKDLQIVRVIAGQASIAIENARLAKKIEEETVIRTKLQRYLSPAVMDRLNKDSLTIRMGGEMVMATVMFTDIRGFTSMSERSDAEELVHDLNEYFELVVDVIFAYEGTLDKFIGDAIMAVWGTPQSHPEDPRRAVQAAVEIQTQLRHFNRKRVEQNRPPLLTGIGINSGLLVAGNMGSPKRLEFTVIGDHVNIASRLCSKAEGDETIISEMTYQLVRDRFRCTELPPVSVKGKQDALLTYRVEGYLSSEVAQITASGTRTA